MTGSRGFLFRPLANRPPTPGCRGLATGGGYHRVAGCHRRLRGAAGAVATVGELCRMRPTHHKHAGVWCVERTHTFTIAHSLHGTRTAPGWRSTLTKRLQDCRRTLQLRFLYFQVIMMTLNIKDPETDRLARRLARVTGESLTEAVNKALRARLEQETRQRGRPIDRSKVHETIKRMVSRPVLDDRSVDAIMGYDARGLPR